jgi:hypothetical protein
MRCPHRRGKRKTLMHINVFALPCIAAIYTVIVLVTCNPIGYLFGKQWRRTNVMHKSTRPAQINFALKEGQTIIGVIDTAKVICFYIGADGLPVSYGYTEQTLGREDGGRSGKREKP